MPDWIAVVILGLIEGITEFIPVSSTGHLLIAEHWLPRQTDLFNIVIQCGAVIAVLPLFPERLKQFVQGWRKPPVIGHVLTLIVAVGGFVFVAESHAFQTRALARLAVGTIAVGIELLFLMEPAARSYLLKILVAFIITGMGGFILEKNNFKLPETLAPVAGALLIGGIAFLGIEWWLRGRKLSDEITWSVAIAVGLGQLVAAVFPGTSRSGSTILLCLLLGLNRPAATEFSFLVGIPTMLAAGALKIFEAFHHHGAAAAREDWGMVLLATVISAAASFIAVKWLLRYVQTHTFNLFGWYRIALAMVILILLFC
jgi:undecaprenyl-diphosphatase